MDSKSYLLDFKSLSNDESEQSNQALMGSVPTPVQMNVSTITGTKTNGHHTMEFFEMCAALIIQLAR